MPEAPKQPESRSTTRELYTPQEDMIVIGSMRVEDIQEITLDWPAYFGTKSGSGNQIEKDPDPDAPGNISS